MLALVSVGIVSVLALSYLNFAATISRRQAQVVDTQQSFYLAEAALAEAYAGLVAGKSGAVATADLPAVFGEGLFWVETRPGPGNTLELRATGMSGAGRTVLSLVVQDGVESVLGLGMWASADLELPLGTLVDAYDSSLGTYAEQAAADGPLPLGQLGTNGSVGWVSLDAPTIDEATRIEPTTDGPTTDTLPLDATPVVLAADVFLGPDGSLSIGTIEVSGFVENAAEARELPPVDVPAVVLAPALVQTSPIPLVLAPGAWGYEGLQVAEDREVVVQGPCELVVGSLSLASGASLVLDAEDGRVSLYVTGPVLLDETAAVVTTAGDPLRTSLQVDGEGPVELGGDAPFHGVLYAPEARVTLPGGFELFGALVAAELELGGAVGLHYDLNLATEALTLELPFFRSWRILELAGGATEGSATSPFVRLGVDRASCPPPASAHANVRFLVGYRDAGGAERVFDGMEHDFDWGSAEEVLAIARGGDVDVAAGEGGILSAKWRKKWKNWNTWKERKLRKDEADRDD